MHYIFQSPEQPLDVALSVSHQHADQSEILSHLPKVMLENGRAPIQTQALSAPGLLLSAVLRLCPCLPVFSLVACLWKEVLTGQRH